MFRVNYKNRIAIAFYNKIKNCFYLKYSSGWITNSSGEKEEFVGTEFILAEFRNNAHVEFNQLIYDHI
jgi:hypothetical protein